MKQKLLLLVLAIGYMHGLNAASAAGVGQSEKIKVLSWNVMESGEKTKYFPNRDMTKLGNAATFRDDNERIVNNIQEALNFGQGNGIDFICLQQVGDFRAKGVIEQGYYRVVATSNKNGLSSCIFYNNSQYMLEKVNPLGLDDVASQCHLFRNERTQQLIIVCCISADSDRANYADQLDILNTIGQLVDKEGYFERHVPVVVVGSFNALNPFNQRGDTSLYDVFKDNSASRWFLYPPQLQREPSFAWIQNDSKKQPQHQNPFNVVEKYNDYAFYYNLQLLNCGFQKWNKAHIGSYYKPLYLDFALPQTQASRGFEQTLRQDLRDFEQDARRLGKTLGEWAPNTFGPEAKRGPMPLVRVPDRAMGKASRSMSPQATTPAAEYGRARREYTGLEEVRPGILQQVPTSSHRDPYAQRAPSPRRSMPVSFQPQARQLLHARDVEKLLRLLKEVDRLKRGRR